MSRLLTVTGFDVQPVVGVLQPGFTLRPDPAEVAAVFEVPLDLLLRVENYRTLRITRGGVEHTTWQIDYEGRRIWGITANLTRRLYDLALAGEN